MIKTGRAARSPHTPRRTDQWSGSTHSFQSSRDGVRSRSCFGQQRVLRERVLGQVGRPGMIIDELQELVQHLREVGLVAFVECGGDRDLVPAIRTLDAYPGKLVLP